VTRRSKTQITSELAKKIADKLKAEKQPSGSSAHDLYVVSEDGEALCFFSIRRGSRKNLGHDHIPGEIHVGPSKAKRLGQCPMSRDEWLEEMRGQGLYNPGLD
jgi:hypothetical protein